MVAAVAVFTDLPTGATAHYRQQQVTGFLATVHRDVAQCNAGLHDAVAAYAAWQAGDGVASQSTAATFTRQAIAVCSFTNSGVVNLGNYQPPQAVASPTVDQIAPQVDAWAYLDAFTFLHDLQTLISQPSSAKDRRVASSELAALHARRTRIESLVLEAQRSHHMAARPMDLVQPASLLPGGRFPAGGSVRP